MAVALGLQLGLSLGRDLPGGTNEEPLAAVDAEVGLLSDLTTIDQAWWSLGEGEDSGS